MRGGGESMADHNCEKCSFRAKYDNNSNSLLGKIWRWHISWCPGWKRYMGSLSDEKRQALLDKYNLNNQQK